MKARVLWLVAIGLGGATAAHAGERAAVAVPATTAPRIDGVLDDAVWAAAPRHDGFARRRPLHGGPAADATSFQLAVDDEALYVAIRADQRAPVARHLARRDQEPASDWIHVAIDGAGDGRSALEFAVDAAGVQVDALWTDDANRDPAWDTTWTAATHVDATGWTAELRLPLVALRLPARPRRVGLQLWRQVHASGEESVWALPNADDPRVVSTFGRLDATTLAGRGRGIAASQHILVEGTRDGGATDAALDLSADLTWQPSGEVVINAAIRPDFGFVEADPAVVNLGSVELFVEERRPLFNEGREIFDVSLGEGYDTLLYSRRIGRPPQGTVDADPGVPVDAPRLTDLIGAVKVSGRPGGGVSYAVLDALTAPATARIGTGEAVRDQVIEPLTHYGAARVVQGDAERRLGALVTVVDRLGDEVPTLVDHAVAGGVDASVRLGARHQIDAVALGSWIGGGTAALARVQRAPVHYFQRPDADHLGGADRTSLTGYGGRLRAARTSGAIRYGVDGTARSPGLELNDVGFLERADVLRARAWLSHHLVNRGAAEKLDNELSVATATTFGGEVTERSLAIKSRTQLTSRWAIDAGARYRLRALDPTVLRGGPALLVEPSLLAFVTVTSDDRRTVQGALTLRAAGDRGHAWALRAIPEVTIRTSSRGELGAALNVSASLLDQQYVGPATTDGGRDVAVGAAWVESADLTLRASYAVSRRLSVQGYAQLFASTADFRDLRRVADPHADRYADRYQPAAGVAEPDFSAQELHAITAVRWEASASTTWSLLWSHDVASRGMNVEPHVWTDLDGLTTAAATDVVILKLSGAFTL